MSKSPNSSRVFYKYHGSGNDFILLEEGDLPLKQEWIASLCHRRLGIGADGLVLLGPSSQADYSMRYFNRDGKEERFCGNALCCVAALIVEQLGKGSENLIETGRGVCKVRYLSSSSVEVSLGPPEAIHLSQSLWVDGNEFTVHQISIGVPHLILFVEGIDRFPLESLGRQMRYHDRYAPQGVNVNLVERRGDELRLRTYERGVEGETLACGTGGAAATIIAGLLSPPFPTALCFSSQERALYRLEEKRGKIVDVLMRGRASFVFQGVLP